MSGGETRSRCAPSPRSRGEGWGEGRFSKNAASGEPPSPAALRASTSPRPRGEVEPAALSMLSLPVEQEAVVLQPHARDLARAHGAQEVGERDRGVGVGEAFRADVGDAVAV